MSTRTIGPSIDIYNKIYQALSNWREGVFKALAAADTSLYPIYQELLNRLHKIKEEDEVIWQEFSEMVFKLAGSHSIKETESTTKIILSLLEDI